jgi:hypothetical protein
MGSNSKSSNWTLAPVDAKDSCRTRPCSRVWGSLLCNTHAFLIELNWSITMIVCEGYAWGYSPWTSYQHTHHVCWDRYVLMYILFLFLACLFCLFWHCTLVHFGLFSSLNLMMRSSPARLRKKYVSILQRRFHMSGVWGRDKTRQDFTPQMWRGCVCNLVI